METSELDTAVRVELYRQIIESGATPSAGELAEALGVSEASVVEALGRLGAGRAIVLEPGDPTRVRMANPFSAVPTPFVVRAGGKSWYGNCIWDSLGILACLGSDGSVECACGDCGDPMTVTVRDGKAEGAGIIHFGVPALHWWDDIVYT